MDKVPDYYEILGVGPTATIKEIREGYKIEALRTHPDRKGPNSSQKQFQLVGEAYFVLTDPTRRREYDMKRKANKEKFQPNMGGMGFENFSKDSFSFFPSFKTFIPDELFNSIFSDLLGDELNATNKGWSGWPLIGAMSGAGIGLIIFNVIGLVIFAFAGYKLGQIRKKTGRSTYDSWKKLSSEQKSKILSSLASKVL